MIQSVQKLTLRQARLLRGLTLQQLADRLGVNINTYVNYERNPSKMSMAISNKFCSILNFKLSEIDFFDSSAKETDSND